MSLKALNENQPNSDTVTTKELATPSLKVKELLARGIAQSRALPKREPEQIWNEFDAVWNEIASQAECMLTSKDRE